MNKLKILQVYDYMKLGGAESHMITLSEALTESGCEVHIAAPFGPAVNSLKGTKIKFHDIDLYEHTLHMENAEKIIRLIEEEEIDVIHVHPFESQRVMAYVKLVKNIPMVTTIHGPYPTPAVQDFIELYDHLIFVSKESLRFSSCVKQQVLEKSSIIPNSVRIPNDTRRIRNRILKLVYVSRIDDDKYSSINFFINAIENIAKEIELEVTIVGSGGKYISLKNEIENINDRLERKVLYLKEGTHEIVNEMLVADVVVGVGRVILEALSIKKIPICIGNDNYVGIVSESNLLKIADVNFTDRNTNQKLAIKLLKEDLLKIVNNKSSVEDDICRAFHLIKRNFNSLSSASKHLELYVKAISMPTSKEIIHDFITGCNAPFIRDITLAYEIKENGHGYHLEQVKEIRLLMVPNFIDNKWEELLSRTLTNLAGNQTLVIRIQPQFLIDFPIIIEKIEYQISKQKNTNQDILIDYELHDSVTELLFLREMDQFIQTDKGQYELCYKCRLLGVEVVELEN